MYLTEALRKIFLGCMHLELEVHADDAVLLALGADIRGAVLYGCGTVFEAVRFS